MHGRLVSSQGGCYKWSLLALYGVFLQKREGENPAKCGKNTIRQADTYAHTYTQHENACFINALKLWCLLGFLITLILNTARFSLCRNVQGNVFYIPEEPPIPRCAEYLVAGVILFQCCADWHWAVYFSISGEDVLCAEGSGTSQQRYTASAYGSFI